MLRPELDYTPDTWEPVADLIARRDLLRSNAHGARHLAATLDAEADQLNHLIADARGASW